MYRRFGPVLLLIVGLTLTGCADDPAASTPAAVPAASSAPGIHEEDMHHHDDPSGPAAPVADAPGAAAAFAAAWVRRDLPAAQWHAEIAVLCEPGFARLLSTVDPPNLPADRITGAPDEVRAPAGGSATYTVPTNGGRLSVTLVDIDGRWLVAANDFTRDITVPR